MAPPNALTSAIDDPLEWERFTRWSSDGERERTGRSSLQLSGIRCAACAPLIERALRALPGVVQVSVNASVARAQLSWDPQRTRPSEWIAALRALGYDAVPDLAAPARLLRQHEQRLQLWRLFVAAFCAMQVMMFATPSYVADAGELGPDLRQLLAWAGWICSLPVMAFSATPFLRGAWSSLRQRVLSMDVPVALGLLITFVASTGATFDPGGVFGEEVYFDSLTMFVAFLLAARALELRARHRALDAVERTLARMPEVAWRLTADGQVEELSVHRLRPGDHVRVPLGAAFPADGTLVDGPTRVDEALLTGEATPRERAPNEGVIAGSVNLGSVVAMRVERIGNDTRLQQIVALMRQAFEQRPATASLADRWARPFLWAVLIAAAAAAAAWSVFDPARAIWVAVAVLIVTCPCALTLATPVSLLAAAGALARRGVIVQRLAALETLARAKHLFIDKTGTLTESRLRVSAVVDVQGHALAPTQARQALARAASLAASSQHPLSRALVAAAAGEKTPPCSGVIERPGVGLSGRDGEGRTWRLGSAAHAGAPPATRARVWLADDAGGQAGFVIDEPLRAGSADAIAALRAQGWQVTLLSGDQAPSVQAVAARAGIDDCRAAATPEGKLATLQQARDKAGAPVVMIGDGVNDAPVLAAADVSIAMGEGALVARAQADLVIPAQTLAWLPELVALARRTRRVVQQNLVWAAAYNAAAVPLALAGWLPPWAAGVGMAASSLLVVLNAMRLAR